MKALSVFAQLAAVSQTKSFRVVRSILSVLLYLLIALMWLFALSQITSTEEHTSVIVEPSSVQPTNCLPGSESGMPCIPDDVIIQQMIAEPESATEKI